jgi:hypothetical protein
MLPVTVNVVPTSLVLFTLIMEAISSSEMSFPTRATRRQIPENGILHSHRSENLKPYIALSGWACSGAVRCPLWGTIWVVISQKMALFIVTAAKTSNVTWHQLSGFCSEDVMCLLWGTNWHSVSQKMRFFTDIEVKTSSLWCFSDFRSGRN